MPYIFRLSGCLKHKDLQNPKNKPLQASEKNPETRKRQRPAPLSHVQTYRYEKGSLSSSLVSQIIKIDCFTFERIETFWVSFLVLMIAAFPNGAIDCFTIYFTEVS